MTFWEFLQSNWGWFAASLTGIALWFRSDIQAWWLKEASADRAEQRRLQQAELDLQRQNRSEELSVQNRLFEVLEKTHAALAQLNVTLPTLLPAISRQIQDSDVITHAQLRDLITLCHEIKVDVAGIYAREGRARPSRKRSAASDVPPHDGIDGEGV